MAREASADVRLPFSSVHFHERVNGPFDIGRNNMTHYPNPLPISCAKRMAWRMPRIFSMEGRIF